jgi:hypothetical protein
MLIIFWNPNGIQLIDAMPKREKYSTRCYVDNILTPICQRLIPAGKCKLVIHAENSPCHTANVVLDFVSRRKVRFARHCPDDPDIAPSDFFPFGDLKRGLRGSYFQTGEELLAEIRKVVSEISPETFLDVVHDWISWCESLIASDGNYCEQIIKWSYIFCMILRSRKDTALGEGHPVFLPESKSERKTDPCGPLKRMLRISQESEADRLGGSQSPTSACLDISIHPPKCLHNQQQRPFRGRGGDINAKQTMITMFFTARKMIDLDVLPKGSKFNQVYFIHWSFPNLSKET